MLQLNDIKNKDNKWLELISSSLFYYILLVSILLRLLMCIVVCIVEILCNGVALCISFQLQGQPQHVGSLKSTMVGNIHCGHQQTLQIKDGYLWLLTDRRERERDFKELVHMIVEAW